VNGRRDVEHARQILDAENLAFVLVRDGDVLSRGTEQGVVELLATVDSLGAKVGGASLADKVVGKAVALIVAHFGLREVDTRIASVAARDYLAARSIPLRADTIVPTIVNRRRDGSCPMELLTVPVDDAAEGVAKLRAFFAARDGV
jgi:hypothetical protein